MRSIKTKLMELNLQSLFILLLFFLMYTNSMARNPESDLENKEFTEIEKILQYQELNEVIKSIDVFKSWVTVINHDNKIIAFGSENDDHIKSILGKSDLLTEISGNKYYRLSFK